MSQPYVGEIRMFGGSFAPQGWAFCNGATMPISSNDTLFNLIGTTYGGDGQNTFGIPDLQGRVPVHQGQGPGLSNYIIGQKGGVESVTLTTQQIPSHSHRPIADGNPGTTGAPANAYFAKTGSVTVYTVPNDPNNPDPPNFRNMNPACLMQQGGNQPHENMQPFVVINYIISLFGIYPSPT
jgi:microcystin-dependent protein